MITEHQTQYHRLPELRRFQTDTGLFQQQLGSHALMAERVGDLRDVTHIIPVHGAEHAQTHVYYAGTPNLHPNHHRTELHPETTAPDLLARRNYEAAQRSLGIIERTEGRHSHEAVALRGFLATHANRH